MCRNNRRYINKQEKIKYLSLLPTPGNVRPHKPCENPSFASNPEFPAVVSTTVLAGGVAGNGSSGGVVSGMEESATVLSGTLLVSGNEVAAPLSTVGLVSGNGVESVVVVVEVVLLVELSTGAGLGGFIEVSAGGGGAIASIIQTEINIHAGEKLSLAWHPFTEHTLETWATTLHHSFLYSRGEGGK